MADKQLGYFSDSYGTALGDARGHMSPAWGALLGGGLTSAGILAAKAFTHKSSNWSKYAGGVGLLAGGIPSVVLIFGKRTKAAGYLGLAVSAIEGLTELIKSTWLEPRQLAGAYAGNIGLYQPEMTGAGADQIAILGDEYGGQYGAAPIEILGETTPAAALGHYQTEMTGAHPLDVMGGGGIVPYSGTF